jgi:predicted 2-oxoglutarate/Fe(II)-dependent dioxygenase YbiX
MIKDMPKEVTKDIFGGAIAIYNDIFTKEQAAEIIAAYEAIDQDVTSQVSFQGAKVGQGHDGGTVRSNQVMAIDSCDIVSKTAKDMQTATELIRDRLGASVRDYCDSFDLHIAFDEGLQLLKYGPGKQYKAHCDRGPGHEYRTLSAVMYLNPSEYEGGSTYFVHHDVNIHPQTPSIALFPSDYAYLHQAKPVISGTKYAVVTWLGEPGTEFLLEGNRFSGQQ